MSRITDDADPHPTDDADDADGSDGTATERALLADLLLLADPLPAPPGGLERLLADLDAPGPFEHLLGAVADLLAVTRQRARAILALLDAPDAWSEGPRPWTRLLHLDDVGVSGAVVGFVRVEPGRRFPHHHHYGDEHLLILQGSCADGARTLVAGDVGRMPPDSAHALGAGADEPLLYLAVVFDGLEIDGEPMKP